MPPPAARAASRAQPRTARRPPAPTGAPTASLSDRELAARIESRVPRIPTTRTDRIPEPPRRSADRGADPDVYYGAIPRRTAGGRVRLLSDLPPPRPRAAEAQAAEADGGAGVGSFLPTRARAQFRERTGAVTFGEARVVGGAADRRALEQEAANADFRAAHSGTRDRIDASDREIDALDLDSMTDAQLIATAERQVAESGPLLDRLRSEAGGRQVDSQRALAEGRVKAARGADPTGARGAPASDVPAASRAYDAERFDRGNSERLRQRDVTVKDMRNTYVDGHPMNDMMLTAQRAGRTNLYQTTLSVIANNNKRGGFDDAVQSLAGNTAVFNSLVLRNPALPRASIDEISRVLNVPKIFVQGLLSLSKSGGPQLGQRGRGFAAPHIQQRIIDHASVWKPAFVGVSAALDPARAYAFQQIFSR